MIKATFEGTDGSLGFKSGEIYTIETKVNRIKGWIDIRATSQTGRKLICAYTNIEKFLENWRV